MANTDEEFGRGRVYRVMLSIQLGDGRGNGGAQLRKALECLPIKPDKGFQFFELADINGLTCFAKAVRVEDSELPLKFPKRPARRCQTDEFMFHQLAYLLVGQCGEFRYTFRPGETVRRMNLLELPVR